MMARRRCRRARRRGPAARPRRCRRCLKRIGVRHRARSGPRPRPRTSLVSAPRTERSRPRGPSDGPVGAVGSLALRRAPPVRYSSKRSRSVTFFQRPGLELLGQAVDVVAVDEDDSELGQRASESRARSSRTRGVSRRDRLEPRAPAMTAHLVPRRSPTEIGLPGLDGPGVRDSVHSARCGARRSRRANPARSRGRPAHGRWPGSAGPRCELRFAGARAIVPRSRRNVGCRWRTARSCTRAPPCRASRDSQLVNT